MNEKALRQGEKLERRIAGHLFMAGWFVGGKKPGQYASRDIDVLVPRAAAWHRVEIKDESNYATSENIIVETRQGRPLHSSGILTSESTLCLHYFTDERLLLYRTNPMRLWLPISGLTEESFAGADNQNGGYKVPIDHLPAEPWHALLRLVGLCQCRLWDYT